MTKLLGSFAAAIGATFTAIVGVFTILNALGGIVAGIWLAVLGQWGSIGIGLASFFISSFLISIVLLPSIGLGLLSGLFINRGSKIGFLLFGTLSNLYVVSVIAVWCIGVLAFFAERADSHSLFPLLLWSYGVALGPWAYMASKDSQGGGGDASLTATFFAQIAHVVVMLMILFGNPSKVEAVLVFGCIMVLSVIIQMMIGYAAVSAEQRANFKSVGL